MIRKPDNFRTRAIPIPSGSELTVDEIAYDVPDDIKFDADEYIYECTYVAFEPLRAIRG